MNELIKDLLQKSTDFTEILKSESLCALRLKVVCDCGLYVKTYSSWL